MTDAELKYKKPGIEVLLITEVFADGPIYILTVSNNPSSTKDTFKNFNDAFNSFVEIVKTLEKEI